MKKIERFIRELDMKWVNILIIASIFFKLGWINLIACVLWGLIMYVRIKNEDSKPLKIVYIVIEIFICCLLALGIISYFIK